ncbi:heterogeneous nuclear ribonucleoprotein R isoform X7 [Leptidea sinapis]|uniref:heterogeneous nuclear ribonucleoprotein R isoform X7 n=1 Tax=Leptidea sinapis TaxID=189913 RepID=UPI0021C26E5E|nr:heterogeneous nuclear ribonucleoprotein R isoform X7 [Leptidea sinapis]
MAEGNGEICMEEVPGKDSDIGRTPDYRKLIEYGLDPKVAAKLDDIYKTGKLAHAELDERALDALKEFPSEGALSVLGQFLDSNLEHVSNKSAYLCGVMKTYRQKSRAGVQGAPALASAVPVKGPDEDKIKQILARTGYTLDVTTGQRKYGGPPPGWEGGTPGAGCEVFCGKIPKDMYEDELIPLFERCGTIWDLRLMMDPMTGTNRGYAFVTFTTRDATQRAVQELDNHEIKPGKTLRIKISVPNLRLFVGNIPKSKGKEEILEEFGKLTAGLVEVIIYSSPDDKKKNRGFCFLEYESHKAASLAKRRLGTGRIKVWGCDIIVDWADPQEEPDEQTMSKVKVLYVRNLTQDITEEALKEEFERYGTVERVKKIKDYAFVHFEDRDCAVKAMQEVDGKDMGGARLEVSLAKPPSDKKKKEEILRARERRMTQMIYGRGGCSPVHGAMRGRTPQPTTRPPQARGDYGGWVMWDGRSVGPARGRGWSPWWCATRRSWAPHAQRHAWQPARQTKFTSVFNGLRVIWIKSPFSVNVSLTGVTRTMGGTASGGWARRPRRRAAGAR